MAQVITQIKPHPTSWNSRPGALTGQKTHVQQSKAKGDQSVLRATDDTGHPGRMAAFSRARRPRRGGGDSHDLSESDPETDVVLGVTQDRNVRSRCRCSMCPAIHIN